MTTPAPVNSKQKKNWLRVLYQCIRAFLTEVSIVMEGIIYLWLLWQFIEWVIKLTH